MAPTDPKAPLADATKQADTKPADTLESIAAEVASIAKTPPPQRTALQNERLQELEIARQKLLPPPAPAPPAAASASNLRSGFPPPAPAAPLAPPVPASPAVGQRSTPLPPAFTTPAPPIDDGTPDGKRADGKRDGGQAKAGKAKKK